MKKLVAIVMAVAIVASLVGVAGVALAGNDGNGNGAPSGPHYTLNIIGMDNPKKATMDCGDGHRIFVPLNAKSTIKLTEAQAGTPEAEAFEVIDCTAWGDGAELQLPNPDPTNSGTTEYVVYLRLLGKPGGHIKMMTCAYDPDIDATVCSDLQVIKFRTKGQQIFADVSAELLYIYAWIYDPNSQTWSYERVPLFDEQLEGYFWEYDNSGVKIAQLRFYYNESTTVPEPEDVDHLSLPNPAGAIQGWCGSVAVDAVNFSFNDRDPASVDFGDDITVSSFSHNAGRLTASICIGAAADEGFRYVIVTFDDMSTLSTPFLVDTP